jgi:transposase
MTRPNLRERNRNIVKEAKKGVAYKKIAKKFKVSPVIVSLHARDAGIRLRRKRGTVRPFILKSLKKGVRPSAIAKKLNVHVNYIYNEARKERRSRKK